MSISANGADSLILTSEPVNEIGIVNPLLLALRSRRVGCGELKLLYDSAVQRSSGASHDLNRYVFVIVKGERAFELLSSPLTAQESIDHDLKLNKRIHRDLWLLYNARAQLRAVDSIWGHR